MCASHLSQAEGNYRTFCTNCGKTASSERGEKNALHSEIKPRAPIMQAAAILAPTASTCARISLQHPTTANLQGSAKQLMGS